MPQLSIKPGFPQVDLPIILGSSSPFRQSVLREAGVSFSVMSPNIDEERIQDVDPERLAIRLSEAKRDAILATIKEPAIVITADQVVVVNGVQRGKPSSREMAREFLVSYRTNYAETVSAVTVFHSLSGVSASGVDRARITIAPIDDATIEIILDEGTVFHCAGGFAVEHPLMAPWVRHIEGTIDSVMGMPLGLTGELVRSVLSA